MHRPDNLFADRAALAAALGDHNYLVDDGLATALYLGTLLRQPILLEGEPGVGKTTAAKTLANALDTTLFRLQCYEGITAAEALYEWDAGQQLLAIQSASAFGTELDRHDLYSDEFLLARPLLQALRYPGPTPAVLLLDEVDRADSEFEALLLEFLAEKTVTIPEFGTVRATVDPVVILTSNRSRDLHDALRRRCLYHWIPFPDLATSAAIVRRHVPHAAEALTDASSAFVHRLRDHDLDKAPGIAETIDWVSALAALGVSTLEPETALPTIGAIAKTPDDLVVTAAVLTES